MAIRVTDYTDVTVLISTDLTQAQVEAFILSASLIVDNQLSSRGLGTTTLKEIEKYLAAHLITLRDPRALNESADGISFGYEGQTGMGLDSSRYGQTAKQKST